VSTACSNLSKQTVNDKEVNITGKLTITDTSSVSTKQVSTNDTSLWDIVEKRSEDIDNDGNRDDITLLSYKDKEEIRHYKISINASEKELEFASGITNAINSLSIKQLVKLDMYTKGILIKLNFEGETSNQNNENAFPWWFDHSFIVVNYADGDILTILDGINLPFNNKNNYNVKYAGDYNIEFLDAATKFSAKYAASVYKTLDDGEERLKQINTYTTSGISNNYYSVKAQDLNSDGIDEIISSKYIPGLYHNDFLGIIEYIFIYEKGKYSLSKEVLKYDGDTGLYIVKQVDIP
jgi:hypothetical protein